MVLISNFHGVLFFNSSIFTNVYIIYINQLHNGTPVALRLPPTPIHSVLCFPLSPLSILITFNILAILLHSKPCFPQYHNALNTQIHSLLVMLSLGVVRSSDTHGVWLWKSRWHLSTLCKTGPWHSHTAGKFPARESPSCAAWCRPPPGAALVCRFSSRSDEHNKTLRCSLKIAGRGRLRALLYVTSWCVVFLDSAIPSRGLSNDHGFDLYAECHPELGCVELGCFR